MGGTPERRPGKGRVLGWPRRLFALPLLLLLAGCGSILAVIDDPPPKTGMAQIVVYRIGNATILPGNAKIEVNGEKIATLSPRERALSDIKPGPTAVTVSSSLLPIGQYTAQFEAVAGQKYIFSIALRGDMIAQALPGSYKVSETPGAAFQIGLGH
jgi:hypothetical protein